MLFNFNDDQSFDSNRFRHQESIPLFEYWSYKEFVRDHLKSLPQKGWGAYRRIAAHLRIQPVIVSQVFRGNRELTDEQALDLSEFLDLSELEKDYFLLLVRIQRAGTVKLKERYKAQAEKVKASAQNLKTRLSQDIEMDEKAQAEFYSNWFFSGIRFLSAVDEFQTAEKIAEHFKLPRHLVKTVVDFLIAHGLCIEENGKIIQGPKRTHLAAERSCDCILSDGWKNCMLSATGFGRFSQKLAKKFSAFCQKSRFGHRNRFSRNRTEQLPS